MPDPVTRLNAALEGRYCIDCELGEGGMATVYLADDLRHERKVALKVLKPELAAVVGADRFLAEIKTTANLQHPHVLPLFDSGAADGFLFFVMPYVEGESLRQRLDRERQLPVEDAVRIVTGVASGLHYAHQRGVVHRDVKPANVMLTGGMPVVADFGISLAMSNAEDSRLTGTGLSIGTPDYMSPEQATGDGEVDARSDLYALGCMLYEMLTGDPPHAASTAQALIAKRLTVPPTPVRTLRPTVPVHIEEALLRALEVIPADRHPSLEAFSRALSDGDTPQPFQRLELTVPSTPVAPPETPFVGREKERAEILERLDQLSEGRGSLVLIGGEPGVGKTRLSELVLAQGRKRGYMCLVGHAYELEGTPPFTPLVEQLEYAARIVPTKTFRAVLGDAAPEVARIVPALRRLFPDIGPGIELPPDQQRQHLFHRYREFAERAARVQPLVLLFDDLHWADEATLLLLEHLAQHLHEMPTLALGTYRDVELEVGRPFAASLERLLRQHRAHRIALRRLPGDQVTELLHKLGGSAPPRALAQTIYHETEGNPFFVQEVFRHLNEEGRLFDAQGSWRSDITAEELDVPEGVRLVVGRRLQRVSEECRKVLTTASVVGPRFALSVLDAVGDVDEDDLFDALDEAEGAHLVVSKGGRRDPVYGFTHELIRQTLIDTLSFPRRQRLHLKISKALEQAYGERIEEHAADLAHHLYHAGAAADADKTLRFLRVAGEQALDGSGYEEALAQFDRALSLEEDVPDAVVPVLLEGKTRALDGMGRWNDVIDVGKRAMELYLAQGDAESAARVAALVTYRMLWWTRVEEIVDTSRRVLDVLPEEPSRARIRLLANLGAALNVLDEEGSLETIERAISDARALGDESALIYPTLTLGLWHLSRGYATESLRALGEALELTERSNDESWRSQILAFRLVSLSGMGRIDDALSTADEAEALGRERGDVGAELQAHLARIVVGAMRTGDGVELEARGRDFMERFHQAGPWRNYGLTLAGLGSFWQGDLDAALVLFDRAVEVLKDRSFSGWPRGWRFMLAAYAGRPDAPSIYRALEPELFRPGGRSRPGNLTALHAAIQGLAFLGDFEEAASHYPGAAESLGFGTVADFAALWQCSTGVAAACAEKWDAAEEHFGTALRQADEIPYVVAGFDTRRWYAWALLRRGASGDHERARELLEEAIAGYRKLSARFLEHMATELLEGSAG